MTDVDKVLKAAKAAFPELWPDEDAMQVLLQQHGGKGGLAIQRQAALGRVQAALEAAGADPAGDATQRVVLIMPDDAMMIQQTLAIITYIDESGKVAYSIRTLGEGLVSSWLGMNVLAQHYLLQQAGLDGENT